MPWHEELDQDLAEVLLRRFCEDLVNSWKSAVHEDLEDADRCGML